MNFFQKLFCVYDKPHFFFLIDNRELKSGYIEFVFRFWCDHYWEVCWEFDTDNLIIGDEQISDDFAIEIKRVSIEWNPTSEQSGHDFLSSMFDGRLWDQTEDRFLNFKRSGMILQVEPGAELYNSKFTEEVWVGMKNDMEVNYNQHIWESSNHVETLWITIQKLIACNTKKDHHNPTNKRKKEKDLYDKQIYLISSLDDVALDKAEKLLNEFGTPLNVIGHIIGTEITYTKTGNIKGTTSNLDGFGPQFFLKNKPIFTQKAIKPIRK